MQRKTLYFDTETTGVDHTKHGLIQLACLIDIDNNVVDEATWFIRPFHGDLINKEASEITGYSREDMEMFPDAKQAYSEICTFFGKHVDKYDRNDKFWPAGYNCLFDLNFLRMFFEKNDDKYFGSWQNWKGIDGLAIIRYLAWQGKIDLPDYKLGTVCEYFGIKLGDSAHDALADIRATRELIIKLKEIE